MKISFDVFTDIGSREVNEDSVKFTQKGDDFCFVLCDGLGGHSKGEVASQIVTDTICECFDTADYDDTFWERAFSQAQAALLREQAERNEQYGMKTTAVCLVIHENTVRYAHIGDSRLYHFRKNKLITRTLDHSVPQMLVLAGDIKEKAIRHHPDRNRLLRVMGIETCKYDVSQEEKLQKTDAFLLCSDGFWETITEKEMLKCLKKSSNASEWMNAMKEIVKANGTGQNMDNNSAIAAMYIL